MVLTVKFLKKYYDRQLMTHVCPYCNKYFKCGCNFGPHLLENHFEILQKDNPNEVFDNR